MSDSSKLKFVHQFNIHKFKLTTLIIVMLVFILLVQFVTRPQRSVSSYCSVYAAEKLRLSKLPGDTWPSGVFNQDVGDAKEIIKSFTSLGKVAPNDIEPHVISLRKIYEDINSNPSNSVVASLSGVELESSVISWTKKNCNQ